MAPGTLRAAIPGSSATSPAGSRGAICPIVSVKFAKETVPSLSRGAEESHCSAGRGQLALGRYACVVGHMVFFFPRRMPDCPRACNTQQGVPTASTIRRHSLNRRCKSIIVATFARSTLLGSGAQGGAISPPHFRTNQRGPLPLPKTECFCPASWSLAPGCTIQGTTSAAGSPGAPQLFLDEFHWRPCRPTTIVCPIQVPCQSE